MSLRFKKVKKDELPLVEKLHKQTFPGDHIRDMSEDIVWFIYDGRRKVGFCSVSVLKDRSVFFSRAASLRSKYGIHRKSILHRLRWANRAGYKTALTYVSKDNYLSIANLIRTGFRFYDPEWAYAGRKDYFYFQKKL